MIDRCRGTYIPATLPWSGECEAWPTLSSDIFRGTKPEWLSIIKLLYYFSTSLPVFPGKTSYWSYSHESSFQNLFLGSPTQDRGNKEFNLLPRKQWKNKRNISHFFLSSWIWAFFADLSQISRCAWEENQLILYIQIYLGSWKYMSEL